LSDSALVTKAQSDHYPTAALNLPLTLLLK
jgi:hypothetical protein